MTYTALAKSLGISLKHISASASATSPNTTSPPASASASAPPPTLAPAAAPFSHASQELISKGPPPPTDTRNDVDTEDIGEPSLEPPAITPADTKEIKMDENLSRVPGSAAQAAVPAPEDADSDIDAEGVPDSDIASSRPPSPHDTVLAQESCQRKGTPEATETLSIQSTSLSQSSDIDQIEEMLKHRPELHPTQRENMSDEDLHHAKVLVLDLLGWGVPPEYLLQRGISHALLYTVFIDLRLRLPDAILEDCVKLVSAQS